MDDAEKISGALNMRSLKEAKGAIIDAEAVEMPEEGNAAVIPYQENLPAVPEPDTEVLEDIDLAKESIKAILEKGGESMTELLLIAKQTESPTAFTALSTMMKTLLDANRDLVNMSKEKKYEKSEQPAQHVTNVTNNNLTLSSADLLRMIRAKAEGDDTSGIT